MTYARQFRVIDTDSGYNLTELVGPILTLDRAQEHLTELAEDNPELMFKVQSRVGNGPWENFQGAPEQHIYFARDSQQVYGAPLLQLDVRDVFLAGGIDGMLREYTDLALIIRISPAGSEIVYSTCPYRWPCVDPQIAQIMGALAVA